MNPVYKCCIACVFCFVFVFAVIRIHCLVTFTLHVHQKCIHCIINFNFVYTGEVKHHRFSQNTADLINRISIN